MCGYLQDIQRKPPIVVCKALASVKYQSSHEEQRAISSILISILSHRSSLVVQAQLLSLHHESRCTMGQSHDLSTAAARQELKITHRK